MCDATGRRICINGKAEKKITVRAAGEDEFSRVQGFYWKLIDGMQLSPFLPGWKKKIYPADDFLLKSLKNGELYVAEEERGSEISAAMVLNHECNAGYEKAKWDVAAAKDDITFIHALGVLPAYQGRGLAKTMVREAIRIARENSQKVIRLDVLSGNVPALKLYESLGFKLCGCVPMYYEDTGVTDFYLFELPLTV